MIRSSWAETWLNVAEIVAKRSRCDRAQVGAVIVDLKQRIIATGYNGPASGFKLKESCGNWCERAQGKTPTDNTYDTCPAIHAEANALLYVDRSSTEGGTIYITHPPCFSCAKLISNSGITRVVCYESENDKHRKPEIAYKYLKDCGLSVSKIEI